MLLKAKQAAMLPEVRPVVDQLQDLGFWLSPGTRDEVLRLVVCQSRFETTG